MDVEGSEKEEAGDGKRKRKRRKGERGKRGHKGLKFRMMNLLFLAHLTLGSHHTFHQNISLYFHFLLQSLREERGRE